MTWSRRALLRSTLMCGGAALVAACSSATPTPAPTRAPAAALATASDATAPPTNQAAPPTAVPTVAANPTAAPIAIRAAWVAKTANQMLWPLAKEAGYFDKYGVRFELSYINGSTTGMAALVARDIDVSSAAGSAVVAAQAGGEDIIMVSGFLNQAVFRVMANPDISSLEAVKGKTVAVTRVGQADYFVWQALIARNGWTQDDVKFVNANDVQGQVGLLQQGQVQAIAVTPPNNVLALRAGAHEILDTATLDLPQQNVGFVTTRTYLQRNRPAVLATLKATIEAIARWKKDATFTKGVIQKYLESDDPQFTDVGYESYLPVWQQAPYVSRAGLLEVIQEVSAQNPKAMDLDVDQLIDNTVVKELEDTGFVKSVYG